MMMMIVMMTMMKMVQKKGLRSTCTSLMSHTCATSRMMVARVAGNRSTVNVQVQEEFCLIQVRVNFQDGCSSFRKPRRTESMSNSMSSWQTQTHMYFKDSMYAMQCVFRRFFQKKMSTFLPLEDFPLGYHFDSMFPWRWQLP